MLIRRRCVRAVLLLVFGAVVTLAGAITPPSGPVKVSVRNGRCIYRGRSVWEALHYPGRRKMRASPLQAQGTPAAFHPDEGMHASTCWKRMLL
ncbi:hypothetical protein MRX96_055821 [Rhipicephalus microplus]